MVLISRVLVVTALLATTASTLRVYPHQLAYFNELAGGPKNGHKHLLHSSLDWGQDLLLAGEWMRERGIPADEVKLVSSPRYPARSLVSTINGGLDASAWEVFSSNVVADPEWSSLKPPLTRLVHRIGGSMWVFAPESTRTASNPGTSGDDSGEAVDERRDVHVGAVMKGEQVKHTFAVRNTTGKPFTVTGIGKSCGCETANLQVGTIVPARGVLEVPYTVSTHLTGERTRRLVIATNAADESFQEIVLVLRAEVQAQLSADPPQLMFGSVRQGKLAEMELRVNSIVPGLLDRFQDVTISRGLVTVEPTKATAKQLVFRVIFSHDAPAGRVQDIISLRFDDRDFPLLNVRVNANKIGPATVKPKVRATSLAPAT